MNPRVEHCGTYEKWSLVENFHEYGCFLRCRYSSTSGGFGLLVPSDLAVIGNAKPLASYLLAIFH